MSFFLFLFFVVVVVVFGNVSMECQVIFSVASLRCDLKCSCVK